MKKKPYEKPGMQVFELKQQPMMLAGSPTLGATETELDDIILGEENWFLMP